MGIDTDIGGVMAELDWHAEPERSLVYPIFRAPQAFDCIKHVICPERASQIEAGRI